MSGYVLTPRSAERLRRLSAKDATAIDPSRRKARKGVYFAASTFPGRNGASSIGAATRTGGRTVCPSGTVYLEREDPEAPGELILDAEHTAYNRIQDTVPAGRSLWLAAWGGKVWIVGYECD